MITWSANISTLFRELPYLDRVTAAREFGFRVMETWWPEDPAALVSRVAEADLVVSLMNMDGGDILAGDRGFANDPARRKEADRCFAQAIETSGRLGGAMVHVLLGRYRDGLSERTQLAAALDCLRDWAQLAEAKGLTLLVEPLNRHDVPGYIASTPAEVARIIEDVGSPAVRMLFDAYHVARDGLDPLIEVAAFNDFIGHVQFADCPGRRSAGAGEPDLWAFVERLEEIGYGGCLGLEFEAPSPTPVALGFLGLAPPFAPFG